MAGRRPPSVTYQGLAEAERSRPVARNKNCNRDQHNFETHPGMWAGLRRTTCQMCGQVQIDLENDQAVSNVSDRLRLTLQRINEGEGLELDLRPAPLFGQAR